MEKGAITAYIDVAQVTLYAFWIFFAGLIIYLRREDKREGYPLVSSRGDRLVVQGYPSVPAPKTFYLEDGSEVQAPRGYRDERPIAAKPTAPWDNLPLIYPLRELTDVTVAEEDSDPRGMTVVGADRRVAGVVKDLWADRCEPQIRYLEVELSGVGSGRRLVPMTLVRVNEAEKRITVESVLAAQFADAPSIRHSDRVTKLEEDKIQAYFGGGSLYATPDRLGPLL